MLLTVFLLVEGIRTFELFNFAINFIALVFSITLIFDYKIFLTTVLLVKAMLLISSTALKFLCDNF